MRSVFWSGNSTSLVRLVAPETNVTSLAWMSSAWARANKAALVARPSTAGAWTATTRAASP